MTTAQLIAAGMGRFPLKTPFAKLQAGYYFHCARESAKGNFEEYLRACEGTVGRATVYRTIKFFVDAANPVVAANPSLQGDTVAIYSAAKELIMKGKTK